MLYHSGGLTLWLREDQQTNKHQPSQQQQQPPSALDRFVSRVRYRQQTGQGAPTAPPITEKEQTYDFSKPRYQYKTIREVQRESRQQTAQDRYQSVQLTLIRNRYARYPSNTVFTDEQGNQYTRNQVLQSIDQARQQYNRPGLEYNLGQSVGSPVSSWDPSTRVAYETRTGSYSPVFPYEGAQYYKEYRSMVNTPEHMSGIPIAYILGGGEGYEGFAPIVGPALGLAAASPEERIRKQIVFMHRTKGSPTGGPSLGGAASFIVQNPQVQWAVTAGLLKGGTAITRGLIRGTKYTKPILQGTIDKASRIGESTIGRKIIDIGKTVTNKLNINKTSIYKNYKLYEKGYVPGRSLVEVEVKTTTARGLTLKQMKYVTDKASKRIFISPEQAAKYNKMLKSGGRLDLGFPRDYSKYGVGKIEITAEGTISRSRLGRIYAYSTKELQIGEKVTASIKRVPVKQSFSEIEQKVTGKAIPQIVQTSEKLPGKQELRVMLQKGYRRTITLESGKEQIMSGEKGFGESRLYIQEENKRWINRLEKKADIIKREKSFVWNEFAAQKIKEPETITLPKKTIRYSPSVNQVRVNVPSSGVTGELGGQIVTPVFIKTTVEGTNKKRDFERIKIPESINEKYVATIRFQSQLNEQSVIQKAAQVQDVIFKQKTVQIQVPITKKDIHFVTPSVPKLYKSTTPIPPVVLFPPVDLFGRGIREYGWKEPSVLTYKFRKANIKLPFSDIKTPRFKL